MNYCQFNELLALPIEEVEQDEIWELESVTNSLASTTDEPLSAIFEEFEPRYSMESLLTAITSRVRPCKLSDPAWITEQLMSLSKFEYILAAVLRDGVCIDNMTINKETPLAKKLFIAIKRRFGAKFRFLVTEYWNAHLHTIPTSTKVTVFDILRATDMDSPSVLMKRRKLPPADKKFLEETRLRFTAWINPRMNPESIGGFVNTAPKMYNSDGKFEGGYHIVRIWPSVTAILIAHQIDGRIHNIWIHEIREKTIRVFKRLSNRPACKTKAEFLLEVIAVARLMCCHFLPELSEYIESSQDNIWLAKTNHHLLEVVMWMIELEDYGID